jgi:hypothetical protein
MLPTTIRVANALKNIRSEFFHNPCEILTNDPAILGGLLEYTSERLP